MTVDEHRVAAAQAARGAVHRLADDGSDPASRLRALRTLRRSLHGLERDEVALLRESGYSWDAIADHTADPDGTNLFDRMVLTRHFPWRCATCDQLVNDYGPQAYTHPDDAEQGHAADCTRHQRDVEAYEHGRGELDALAADEARAAADASVWDETS